MSKSSSILILLGLAAFLLETEAIPLFTDPRNINVVVEDPRTGQVTINTLQHHQQEGPGWGWASSSSNNGNTDYAPAVAVAPQDTGNSGGAHQNIQEIGGILNFSGKPFALPTSRQDVNNDGGAHQNIAKIGGLIILK